VTTRSPTTPAGLADRAAVRSESLTLAHRREPALQDATFELPAGRVTALIGPNGAGKSTLLHAIAGLLKPRSGSLEVVSDRRVAYVLQTTKVNDQLPITVRETVTMGRYARTGALRRMSRDDRRAVDEAMQALGITGLERRQLGELSGGQRQRAFVAQGLAQRAEILLLDEPITGLDLVSREHILHAIDHERDAGRTVIVSTHDLGDAAQADHVLLLAGRVVAQGPPAEVLTDEHLATAYGGHLLRLGDRTIIVDDHAHH
jgi:ABC-type Mn2+/Zn2+ transport system ATPase subunit